MNWWGEDFGYWMGWIACGFVAVFGVLLIAIRMFAMNDFCAQGSDDHCFREWVSALGGWAAVVVAVPTILYLSKQIRDADRHSRNAAAISLWTKRAAASRVIGRAETFREVLEAAKGRFQRAQEFGGEQERQAMLGELELVSVLARDDAFPVLEREIETPKNAIFTIVNHFERLTDRLRALNLEIDSVFLGAIYLDALNAFELLWFYVNSSEVIARNFLSETDSMI